MRSLILMMLFLCLVSCQAMKKEILVEKIADFSEADYRGEIWIKELKYSRENKRIAVKVNYKEQDDIEHRFFIMRADGSGKQEIKSLNGFNKPTDQELSENVKGRLQNHLEDNFKSHAGILGGTVKYKMVSYTYSSDKSKIAFIIRGEDGHAIFDPSLLVYCFSSKGITNIDSAKAEMCEDVIWISDKDIVYAKKAAIFKAALK